MKLSKEQILHIAHLSRLHLNDEEAEVFAVQLSNILSYVDRIKELDTEGVPETHQVTGLKNVTRKDELREPLCTPQELLDCSPLPQKKGQLIVKRMM